MGGGTEAAALKFMDFPPIPEGARLNRRENIYSQKPGSQCAESRVQLPGGDPCAGGHYPWAKGEPE